MLFRFHKALFFLSVCEFRYLPPAYVMYSLNCLHQDLFTYWTERMLMTKTCENAVRKMIYDENSSIQMVYECAHCVICDIAQYKIVIPVSRLPK